MPKAEKRRVRPCCLVSELLEEAGIDRERVRELRRQVLQGIILLCRWQLERLEPAATAARRPGPARKIDVE